MAYRDNLTEWGFGQLGSGYLSDGAEFTPPTGLVVVAMTVVLSCKFEELVQDNQDGVAYFGGESQTSLNGTNSDQVPGTELFPAGITMYGRWSKVELSQGAVILYFGS